MVNNQEGNFTKIYNDFVIGEENIMQRYKKDISDKILLVYIYLNNNVTRQGKIKFTLSDLIEENNYKQKTGAGKTNEQFKNTLIALEEEKILKVINKVNLKNIGVNDFIICTLEDPNKNFFQLYEKEINIIINSNHSKVTQVNLLKLFCCLKARMYKRSNGEKLYQGKYEVCFPGYKQLVDDLNVGEGKIKQYIDILVELDLIRYDNGGDKVKNKVLKTDNNTYTLYKEGWKEELKGSIKYNKEKNKELGWKYITIKNNNRKLGGEKTQLLKKLSNGKATSKDKNRLIEINEVLNKE